MPIATTWSTEESPGRLESFGKTVHVLHMRPSGPFSLLLCESIQFARGTEIEGIVRDSRRGGYAFAEFWVLGDDFRLGGPGLQDRHGPIVQRRKINVPICCHR